MDSDLERLRKHECGDDKKQTSKEKRRERDRKRYAERRKREKAVVAASDQKVVNTVDESVSVASQKLIIAKRNKKDASEHKRNPEEQKRRHRLSNNASYARKKARGANDVADEFNRLLSGTEDVDYGYCKECTFSLCGDSDVVESQEGVPNSLLSSSLDERYGASNRDDVEDSNVLPSGCDVTGCESCMDCVDCCDNMDVECAVESLERESDRREEVRMNLDLNEGAFAVAGLRENSFATNKSSDGDGIEKEVNNVGGDSSFAPPNPVDSKRVALISRDVLECIMPLDDSNAMECYVLEMIKRTNDCVKRSHYSTAKLLAVRAVVAYELLRNIRGASFVTGLIEVVIDLYILTCRCFALTESLILTEFIEKIGSLQPSASALDIYRSVFRGCRVTMSEIEFTDAVRRGNLCSPNVAVSIADQMDLERFRFDENKRKKKPEVIRWHCFTASYGGCCDNCHRVRSLDMTPDSPYWFDFYALDSFDVKREKATRLRHVVNFSGSIILCTECTKFLSRRLNPGINRSWDIIWPSFFWNLLTGRDERTKSMFAGVYSPEHLWRFVPDTVRSFWRTELLFHHPVTFGFLDEQNIYNEPACFFVDRTLEICEFRANISSYSFKGLLMALEPSRITGLKGKTAPTLSPTLLCPWGCSEFPTRCKFIEPSLIIQHMLPLVQLNLTPEGYSSFHLVESSRLDYIRREDEDIDYLMMNKKWAILPTVFMVSGKGMMVGVCRHHGDSSTQRRLYCHSPRKPKGMKLSAFRADQHSHVVHQPRIAKAVRKRSNNTVSTTMWFRNTYQGSDSANISLAGRFACNASHAMNMIHECLSMDRRDLRCHSHSLVREGIVHEDVVSTWMSEYQEKYTPNVVKRLKRGGSYVPTINAIQLQSDATGGNLIRVVTEDFKGKGEERCSVEVIREVKKGWCGTIYNMQVEDGDGYGVRPKKIPSINTKNTDLKGTRPDFDPDERMSMLTWVLVGTVSGCKELYRMIDQKVEYHSYRNFSGFLLTFIHVLIMKQCDTINDRRSPFQPKLMSVQNLRQMIGRSLPVGLYNRPHNMRHNDEKDYYGFGLSYMKSLFPCSQYRNLLVCESKPNNRDCKGIEVAIVISTERPDGCAHFWRMIDGKSVKFECRVLVGLESNPNRKSPLDFDGIRYVRHGGGFCNWWRQDRSDSMTVQCPPSDTDVKGADVKDPMPHLNSNMLSYISVYVRDVEFLADQYRSDIMRSVGGQNKLFCACNGETETGPFIITSVNFRERRPCRILGCRKPEKYICPKCSYTICNGCFEDIVKRGDRQTINRKGDPLQSKETEKYVLDNLTYGSESEDSEFEIESVLSGDEDDELQQNCCSVDEEEVNDIHCDVDYSVEFNGYDDDKLACGISRNDTDNVSLEEYDGVKFGLRDCVITDCDFDIENYGYESDTSEGSDDDFEELPIPKTNSGVRKMDVVCKDNTTENETVNKASVHILFNQVGRLLTRNSKPIDGTMAQKSLIQGLVSNIEGNSIPLLYVPGMIFPKHFWASATNDESSIIGSVPISCYRSCVRHPDGFASLLEMTRYHLTSSSSSTATDDNFISFCYDGLVNIASCGHDSRISSRSGFTVDNNTKSGLKIGDGDESNLKESLESTQAVMNLAAAAVRHPFDLFLTFTCNQKTFPGITFLYFWKESMEWTELVETWDVLGEAERNDVKRSMEMMYSSILARCWFEVKEIWINFIMESTSTTLGKVTHGFFRDEYQEDTGNLPHIHGLIKIDRRGMDDEVFKEFLGDLQKNDIGNIVPTTEIASLVDKGLLRDIDDWVEVQHQAKSVLTHSCASGRCFVWTGPGPKDGFCKVQHPVFASDDPLENEYKSIPFEFSDVTLKVLERAKLYIPPREGEAKGQFLHDMFMPKKHVGKVLPRSPDKMSPVMTEHFLFSRASQNMQVVCATNGVARYVVKYIVKIDKCSKISISADPKGGSNLQCTVEKLGNTKITSNRLNQKINGGSYRSKELPSGYRVCIPKMIQDSLGYANIRTNIEFDVMSLLPLEMRGSAKVKLDKYGLPRSSGRLGKSPDAIEEISASNSVRKIMLSSGRQFTDDQRLILQSSDPSLLSKDKVSLFGVRPVELLKLVRSIGKYYEWMVTDGRIMKKEEIANGLKQDIRSCWWIDGIGRRIRLRKCAILDFVSHLGQLRDNLLDCDSILLRDYLEESLLHVLEGGTSIFVYDDGKRETPTVVFNRVNPQQNMRFVYHVLLQLGKYDTELDFKHCSTLREIFFNADLFPEGSNLDNFDPDLVIPYIVSLVIKHVLPPQPVGLYSIDGHIPDIDTLFESVLVKNSIPVTELPACLSNKLVEATEDEIIAAWNDFRSSQLKSMLTQLTDVEGLPSLNEFVQGSLSKGVRWMPTNIPKKKHQSDKSYEEQQFACKLGVGLVNDYICSLGRKTAAKGMLINGTPGAGKTFVLQSIGLYAIGQGLNVMSTSFMAVRSVEVGGLNLHQLFKMSRKTKGNLFYLSELAKDNLHRRTNIKVLHLLMTMDVLLIDECGQISAEMLAIIDVILRNVRKSIYPFGGVLIIGSFDHKQLGSIRGLPFLLSHHILTDFTIVRLERSVRAATDEKLQRLQQIMRMNPDELISSNRLYNEFREILINFVHFVDSMEDTPVDTIHCYSRRTNTAQAREAWVRKMIRRLTVEGIDVVVCEANDYKKCAHKLAEPVVVNVDHDQKIIKMLDRHSSESRTLAFFKGCLYEGTVNSHGKYYNSQILLMLDVPSQDHVNRKKPIKMYAAPPGSKRPNVLHFSTPPSREEVLDIWGWKEVTVEHAPENYVSSSGLWAYRKQYPLVHLGNSTVNKTMGSTITMNIAIECTQKNHPWDPAQIVVGFSRSERCDKIYIVTDDGADGAVQRIWETLCVRTQWTAMSQDIINKLAITAPCNGGREVEENKNILDVNDTFPWRICDFQLPTSYSGGCIYLLTSVNNTEFIDVGQTKRSIAERLDEHQRGQGNRYTNYHAYRPFAVAAFICNLGKDMDRSGRQKLESRWQGLNELSKKSGKGNLMNCMNNGVDVVKEYNEGISDVSKHIRLVKVFRPKAFE